MASPKTVTIQPASRVRGRVRPPGDKSISHRYALLSALADGTSSIHGYSTGGDCRSTLDCLRALGVSIEEIGRTRDGLSLRIVGRGLGGFRASRAPRDGWSLRIVGRGLGGFRASGAPLDAGNSGSTMRMMAGALTAHPFASTMTGDDLSSPRP